MTLVYMDSFETYDTTDEQTSSTIKGNWSDRLNTGMIDTVTYKTGSQSFKSSYLGGTAILNIKNLDDVIIFGLHFNTNNHTSRIIDILNHDDLDTQFRIGVNSSYYLYLTGWGSTETSTTTLLSADTWYYLEAKLTVSNSIPADSCVVKIDGTEEINLAATTDTQTQGTPPIEKLKFLNIQSGRSVYIDNLWVCNDSGSVNNDFLGEVEVACLRPNGNGNSSQWDGSDGNQVDNYLLVDDTYLLDSDTDNIKGQTTGEIDLFTYDNIAQPTIKGVQLTSACLKPNACLGTLKNMCRTNSTNYEGSEFGVDSDLLCSSTIWENNPNTGVAWTLTNLNAAEFGIKVV